MHKVHFLALQSWPKRRTINGLNQVSVGDIERRTILLGFYTELGIMIFQEFLYFIRIRIVICLEFSLSLGYK